MKRRVDCLISRFAERFSTEPAIVREALAICGYPVAGNLVYLPAAGFPRRLADEILQVHAERARARARTPA